MSCEAIEEGECDVLKRVQGLNPISRSTSGLSIGEELIEAAGDCGHVHQSARGGSARIRVYMG